MKQLALSILLLLGFNLSNAQISSKKIDSLLLQRFSKNETKKSGWIFEPGKRKVKKIKMPFLQKLDPNLTYYKVGLTHYSNDINRAFECLFVYKKGADTLYFFEPLSFSDRSKFSFSIFSLMSLKDDETIHKFVKEVQQLMLTGTDGVFENTVVEKNIIKFELTLPINNNKTRRIYELKLGNNRIISAMVDVKTIRKNVVSENITTQ